ncbi:MAG: hypothetical protein B6D54_00540 [Epsilonproteobacteria bacterium 4484_65]|nr:MAG: hypothetical protein B6D54_00540 [Epsilonproteobacteria bacterium 4484_65]
MLKTYFGEWGTGKLQRLPYLGYHLLLMVLIMVIIMGTIFAVGAVENFMGGNLAETQKLLMDKFGFIAIAGIMVLIFAAMLGQLNILGKRIRDMGLPVLGTILGIMFISLILNIVLPPQEVAISAAAVQTADGSAAAVATTATTTNVFVQIFDMIVFLCLVFIPSNTFGNK